MYAVSQDVERLELQRETSCLSSVEGRRDEKTEDAPHCVTCYCLPSKIKCSRYRQMYERCAKQQRTTTDYNAGDYIRLRCHDETKPSPLLLKSTSGRRDDTEKRLSERKTTTLDDILRRMKLDETFEEEILDCSKTEEDEQAVASLCTSPQHRHRRRRHRPSGTGSYRNRHQVTKLTETSAHNSCDGGQRWSHDDIVVPQIEDIETDASASKLPNDDWQQQRLEDNAMPNVEKDRSQAVSEPEESSLNNLLKEFGDEAHVRELKLVRWDFIERIREEVHKLYRLQRHLDSCSPRGPSVRRTRSVHTTTGDEPGGA